MWIRDSPGLVPVARVLFDTLRGSHCLRREGNDPLRLDERTAADRQSLSQGPGAHSHFVGRRSDLEGGPLCGGWWWRSLGSQCNKAPVCVGGSRKT